MKKFFSSRLSTFCQNCWDVFALIGALLILDVSSYDVNCKPRPWQMTKILINAVLSIVFPLLLAVLSVPFMLIKALTHKTKRLPQTSNP